MQTWQCDAVANSSIQVSAETSDIFSAQARKTFFFSVQFLSNSLKVLFLVELHEHCEVVVIVTYQTSGDICKFLKCVKCLLILNTRLSELLMTSQENLLVFLLPKWFAVSSEQSTLSQTGGWSSCRQLKLKYVFDWPSARSEWGLILHSRSRKPVDKAGFCTANCVKSNGFIWLILLRSCSKTWPLVQINEIPPWYVLPKI